MNGEDYDNPKYVVREPRFIQLLPGLTKQVEIKLAEAIRVSGWAVADRKNGVPPRSICTVYALAEDGKAADAIDALAETGGWALNLPAGRWRIGCNTLHGESAPPQTFTVEAGKPLTGIVISPE